MNTNLRPVIVESNIFEDGMDMIFTEAKTVSELRDDIAKNCNVDRERLTKMKFVDGYGNDYAFPDVKIPFLKDIDWNADEEERMIACEWTDESQTAVNDEAFLANGHALILTLSEQNKYIQSGMKTMGEIMRFIRENELQKAFVEKYSHSMLQANIDELNEFYEANAPKEEIEVNTENLAEVIKKAIARIDDLEAEVADMKSVLKSEFDYESKTDSVKTATGQRLKKGVFTNNR